MDFINSLVQLKIIPFLKKWNLLNYLLVVIDILTIALAYQFSYYINFNKGGFFFTEKNLLFLFLGILPFWLLILYLIKITEIPRTKSYWILFFEYFQSAVAIMLFLIIFYFVFKLYPISRLFQIEFIFFGFLFLFAVRVLEYKIFKNYRAKGFNQVNIVLIADDSALPFIETLLTKKEWGYRIVAIFSRSVRLKEKYEKDIVLFSEEYLAILNDLMEVNIIDEVLYVKNKVVPSEVRNIISSCEELGVIFRLSYEGNKVNTLTNAIRTNIANVKFLNFINVPHNSLALSIKRIMDINISLFMLIILSPVLLIIAVLIKLTSQGPVIYKQTRVGLRRRQFIMYKFRTMIANAELLRKDLEGENEADGPVFKIKEDHRIIKIGKFLRKTGLDELPQLFNILKGEMSLIGPRPPLPSETQYYKRWQLRRLSVKPGLSCFWQIKPDRNRIEFKKWMELDLAYIDNWSLRLDIIILLKTIKTVFQRGGL